MLWLVWGEKSSKKVQLPPGAELASFLFFVFHEIFNTRVILFMKLSEFEGQGCYGN